MAIARARTGLFMTLVTGSTVFFAGCGSNESTDLSGDSLSTKQELTSAQSTGASVSQSGTMGPQKGSVGASRLDIRPPAAANAGSSAKAGASDATYTQAARTFATQYASRYGLAASASALDFLSIRRSLLGVHVTLQEKVGGIPVAASTFTVSFDNSSGSVYRVHSTVFAHQGGAGKGEKVR